MHPQIFLSNVNLQRGGDLPIVVRGLQFSVYILKPASSGAPSTAARLLLSISLGILKTVCLSSKRESKVSHNPGRSSGLGFLLSLKDENFCFNMT